MLIFTRNIIKDLFICIIFDAFQELWKEILELYIEYLFKIIPLNMPCIKLKEMLNKSIAICIDIVLFIICIIYLNSI